MNNLTKGILLIIISSFGYACMSLFIKLSGNNIPVIQKMFFRNLLTFIIAFYMLIKSKDSFFGHNGDRKVLLFRGIIGTLGTLANFYGVEHLILPNATILNQLGPFFIIIFSFIFLKEKIKGFQAISLIIAFIGIGFIVGPGSNMPLIPSIVEILAAVSLGIVFTCIKYLSDKEKPETIVFWFSATSILVSLPVIIFNFVPMTFIQVIYLLLAGFFTVFGQFGATIAYKFAPAKDISIFSYTQVIFATIFSSFIFNAIPSINSFMGYFIVIGAAIISFLLTRKDLNKATKTI